MERFTKKVQREIVHALRNVMIPVEKSRFDGTVARIAAIEPVDDEPVTFAEAHSALGAAGWRLVEWPIGSRVYIRADRSLSLRLGVGGIVTETRYCPVDLLDGRLADLDKPEDPDV